MNWLLWVSTWLLWVFGVAVVVFAKDLTMEPGHLKPFGDARPSQPVEELHYFPSAKDFFQSYVKNLKPVKMTGAAKMSEAFRKWTDDYFLTLKASGDYQIAFETRKKENRAQKYGRMQFKDFVQMYNNTEHYMIDSVPSFLRQDIMIPCPLQCKSLIKRDFHSNTMWYSSGGTKSVVHTYDVDNIICLYRGNKTLVLVDPAKYADNIVMITGDSYSAIDVDRVDYTKFPGMTEVEFYNVNITAGDCLYIPYQWIHQVRSYGNNLAVNVWWQHQLSAELDYSQCSEPCNPEMTLEHVVFHELDEFDSSFELEGLRSSFALFVESPDGVTLEQFAENLFGNQVAALVDDEPDIVQGLDEAISVFALLDINKDKLVSTGEVEAVPNKTWNQVASILKGMTERKYENDEKDDEQTCELHDEL